MTNDKTFHELWRDLEERSRRWAIPIVQDYKELEYIFNLIKGCESYLEIGTAEGNTLYVLGHALNVRKEYGETYECYVTYVDYGEKHTKVPRDEVIDKLEKIDVWVAGLHSNSHLASTISLIQAPNNTKRAYEVVFIDAGHTYEDVIADAIAYGHLATKYIIFHDICLPDVRRAYDWYLAQNPQFKHHEFINSETYGYGIIEV